MSAHETPSNKAAAITQQDWAQIDNALEDMNIVKGDDSPETTLAVSNAPPAMFGATGPM
ncbi:hypothetical protein PHLCEN_2v2557 [Hermanssonia centrifuga]|uniref:Uncharacterized protein n=1 Tax=Hermanssonia centrifuga TaxID=98765 RepID=A0A2R6RLP4_9APHY|nr:hypothetical protein PHLCEN_2v2557 [Hermanssonia centrifuga]